MDVAEYGAGKILCERVGTERYDVRAYLDANTRESVDITAEGGRPALF